jgi:hypothetical protein
MVQKGAREELESKLEQLQLRFVAVVDHTARLRTLIHSREELRTRIQAAIDAVENCNSGGVQDIGGVVSGLTSSL